MDELAPRTGGLREVTRAAVRAHISDVAIALFAERGFDAVTVEQIAAGAGISPRSFHRYFPAKEDAVLAEAEGWSALVGDSFAARPADEPVWTSLRLSYEALFAPASSYGEREKQSMRVLISTASLRARNFEKHLRWAEILTPLVAERVGGKDALLRARALVQASLAALDVALLSWAQPDETRTPLDLLQECFRAIHSV